MRIVHVVESLERGGLERVVTDLAIGQTQLGHSVAVVCIFGGGILASELESSGICVSVIGKRKGIDVAALLRMRTAILRLRPQIVHSHNAVAAYLGAVTTAVIPGLVRVSTRHGMGTRNPKSRRERLYVLASRAHRHLVAVCDAARFQYATWSPAALGRMVVVRNGIQIEKRHPTSLLNAEQLRVSLGIETDAFVIGTIGRLSAVKNQIGLLRAFASVLALDSRARLVIVGDGEERKPLEQSARSLGIHHSVTFLGDRHDAREILNAFDVFALPSTSEGYSVALLEACAAGLAIVCTAVGGNVEIIESHRTGILVLPNDEAALVNALSRLQASPVLRRELGGAARAWAAQNASVSSMVASYDALYSR